MDPDGDVQDGEQLELRRLHGAFDTLWLKLLVLHWSRREVDVHEAKEREASAGCVRPQPPPDACDASDGGAKEKGNRHAQRPDAHVLGPQDGVAHGRVRDPRNRRHQRREKASEEAHDQQGDLVRDHAAQREEHGVPKQRDEHRPLSAHEVAHSAHEEAAEQHSQELRSIDEPHPQGIDSIVLGPARQQRAKNAEAEVVAEAGRDRREGRHPEGHLAGRTLVLGCRHGHRFLR
mmetsp:Transcript_8546/g.32178  ORF Transcript_8546/g.32178 Transcript_8546/m.32178 type:complete len:233 (-) Transcript_8546:209-907(-)